MNKIVISGYYGFNNIGDESILEAIIFNIKHSIDDVEITVLSKEPELTYEENDVKVVDRKNIFRIIKEIKNCDLLISGGGGLLQDVTSSKSILYYLVIMVMGRMFKKKVMIYSQGIGPICSPLNRFFTKHVLNKVDFITLRDEESKRFLEEINVVNKNIKITADPVISLKKVDLESGYQVLKKLGLENCRKPLVGFSVRGRDKNQKLIDTIANVCDKIIAELDVNVVLIPFHHGEDLEVIDDIKGKMNKKAISFKEEFDTNTMLSIIGNLDLLVGVRLHSLIFGAIMNTPMIAISYDTKINSFMKYLDEDVFSNIEDLEEEKLLQEIKDKIINEEKYKLQLCNKIEHLKEKLHGNEEIISQLLNVVKEQR